MSGDGLNRAQRTAVTTVSGPLLVLAGAGTGKTRVITFRIAELIKDGIKPSRILAVTFTNKAAREMRERALALLKKPGKKSKGQKDNAPEISTFHSLCVRILRRNAGVLGYSENFTIYDRSDQESACRAALRDIRVGQQKLRPGDLLQQIGSWKSAGLGPRQAEAVAKTDAEVLAALAYAKYQASLRASSAMDFDDLLLLTVELLEDHPSVRFAEASRFDHLLIDEYQDTNALQYRIVRALAERHRNLCVVGDDDQSIYGWRGAEVEHILGFAEQWPGSRVVRLEENYRSTEWILHLANTLIAHNKTRHEKTLSAARGRGIPPRFVRYEDESAEAEAVVMDIHTKVSREDEERIPASHIAILFRTNEQPRAFEQELRRHGIPYILVGGQSFYDRKEIKDLVSYLRVLANPLDEVSLLRIINTPSRGIGTSSIQALLDRAIEEGEPLWKLLPRAETNPAVTPGARMAIEGFVHLVGEFRARLGSEALSLLVKELIARIDYKSELERTYRDPGELEARWNAVEEFVNAVSIYESRSDEPSLNGFLEESALKSRDDEKEDTRQEHAVTLMTLHSAKGLEFPVVYLVGLEEGLLPHKRSVAEGVTATEIEEERRLAYVGVTRAQDLLTLSYSKNRMKWGKLRPQLPSRFLFEMRGETEKARELAVLATEQITKEMAYGAERAEEAEKGKKGKKGAKATAGEKRAKADPRAGEEKRPARKATEVRGPDATQEDLEARAASRRDARRDRGPTTPGEAPRPARPMPAPRVPLSGVTPPAATPTSPGSKPSTAAPSAAPPSAAPPGPSAATPSGPNPEPPAPSRFVQTSLFGD